MNGLRILSKISLDGRVGHVGPTTLCRGLKSLDSKTSTYSLFYLAIAFDIKAYLFIFGRPLKLLVEAEFFLSKLFRVWLKYFDTSVLIFLFCSLHCCHRCYQFFYKFDNC